MCFAAETAMVCLYEGMTLTIQIFQMKPLTAITATTIIGLALNLSRPAEANWSQEMRECQVSFKDSFSQTIASRGLYVSSHSKLDAIAYDYCQVALTAIASGDSMSAAIDLAHRAIRAKYNF